MGFDGRLSPVEEPADDVQPVSLPLLLDPGERRLVAAPQPLSRPKLRPLPREQATQTRPEAIPDLATEVLGELTDRPIERLPQRQPSLLGRLLADTTDRIGLAKIVDLAALLETQALRDPLLFLDHPLGCETELLLTPERLDVLPRRVRLEHRRRRLPLQGLRPIRVRLQRIRCCPDLDGDLADVGRSVGAE